MRRLWLATASLSAIGLVASAVWVTVALSVRQGDCVWNFDLHQHPFPLPLSSDQTGSVGTTCYSLVTDGGGVQLWYTDITPIVAPGPDGKPTIGLWDPVNNVIFHLPVRWMVAAGLAFAVSPVAWVIGRSRQQSTRGFPVVRQ